jgi:hypothetical protein
MLCAAAHMAFMTCCVCGLLLVHQLEYERGSWCNRLGMRGAEPCTGVGASAHLVCHLCSQQRTCLHSQQKMTAVCGPGGGGACRVRTWCITRALAEPLCVCAAACAISHGGMGCSHPCVHLHVGRVPGTAVQLFRLLAALCLVL